MLVRSRSWRAFSMISTLLVSSVETVGPAEFGHDSHEAGSLHVWRGVGVVEVHLTLHAPPSATVVSFPSHAVCGLA